MPKQLWVGIYDLLTAKGSSNEFIDKCVNAGATGLRMFGQYTKKAVKNVPFKQVVSDLRIKDYEYNPEQRANIKKKNSMWWFNRPENPNVWLPLYDLEDFKSEFFANLFSMGLKLKLAGLALHIDLDDYCSLKRDGIDKYLHPYYCSIQALSTSTIGGVWGNAMKKYIAGYWKRALKSLLESRVTLYGYSMNEYDSKDNPDTVYLLWNNWATSKLNQFKLPKNRLIASASRLPAEIAKTAKFFSCHGIATPEPLPVIIPIPNNRLIISNDGGRGSGREDAKGRKGASVSESIGIAEGVLKYNYAGAESLDRGLWKDNNDIANLDDFDPSCVNAMAQVFNG